MSTTVEAVLLGVLQGLTEFLPVSSTAHLLVGGRLIGFADPGGVFTVMIQLGSILAVMWLYRRKIAEVLRGLPSSPEARHFTLMILVAFVPSLVVGGLFAHYVQGVLYNSLTAIAVAFVVGGMVMLVVERFRPAPTVRDTGHTSLMRAFGIGVCQMLALVPGVSRAGATIVGGMLMGLDRRTAAEFSFFLAMPTMVGAFARNLYEIRDALAPERLGEIGIGFLFAFVAAAVVVKPFLRVVSRSGFAPFSWYRIAFGLALYAAIRAGWG
jgi:undecaprenyl-diphosphatase